MPNKGSHAMTDAQIQSDDNDEWMTAAEVAAMLKVTRAHVYQAIPKIPGCEPIRLSTGKLRPEMRFHKGRLIAGLREYARNTAKEKTPG